MARCKEADEASDEAGWWPAAGPSEAPTPQMAVFQRPAQKWMR
jgi:hypothetical protein